jgi:hypothetical protein
MGDFTADLQVVVWAVVFRFFGLHRRQRQTNSAMGIHDRDYMKRRRPPDDDSSGASPEARLEAFFRGFLRRHPRLPWAMGMVLVLVIVLLAIAMRFLPANR